MKKFFFTGLFLLNINLWAQEINCTVTVNYSQLANQRNSDTAPLERLKSVISDFINMRRWTNDAFKPEERINCKFNITLLSSPSQGEYRGTLQIAVMRPVYGTNYETIIFNHVDRSFNFSYLPNNMMVFNENSYSDELTHTLAFYAYVILALDYDSFSRIGGSPYIQKAFQLVNIAQSNTNADVSWRPGGDMRSRYALMDNLQNQLMLPFRESLYTYHRLALDTFTENPVAARKKIMDVLATIQQLNQAVPMSVLINSFFDAKGEELFRIMAEGTPEEKQKTFNVIAQIDPAKTEQYRKLLRQ